MLGFGHCLHISSSGLLATLQLTGRRNTGAAVRVLNLSLPILDTNAQQPGQQPLCQPASLCQPLSPILFSSLPTGLPKTGLPAKLLVTISLGANPSRGHYKEVSWTNQGWVPRTAGIPFFRAAGVC